MESRIFWRESQETNCVKTTALWRCGLVRVLLTVVFAAGALTLAAEPCQSAAVQKAGVGDLLKRNVFGLTILLIFLGALVGAFITSRSKDKCLRDFRGYRVTIETADGRYARGNLRVYSNGIELEYAQARMDADGNPETTFIFYDKQYSDLRRICRYSGELTREGLARRKRELRRTSNPSIFRRLGRWLRSVGNTFRDALLESIGAAVAHARSAHPSSAVVTTQGGRLSKIGETVVGYAARAFDPVLEKHIFDPVLVEEMWGDQLLRHRGVLKEYSRSFIEVLDVELKGEFRLAIAAEERVAVNPDFDLKLDGKALCVSNCGSEPATLKEIVGKDFRKEINRKVVGGESVRVEIGGDLPRDAVLVLEGKRRADVLFPRTRASVRYGSG
jgi:small nuclear ribonucleoprotein (snRNP)-like protein